jgi:hypothetical protein
MTRRLSFAWAALAALFFILTSGNAPAAGGRGYLDLSAGYKTGDFGTSVRTDLNYLTATLGYASPDYDVSVAVPWLRLSNSTTETGIGDIIVRGAHVLLPEGKKGVSLDGSVAVKLPTADDTKGLGTGEADYGAFLGLHQRIDSYRLSLLGGYILTGNPPGVDLRDIYLYGIGLTKIFRATEIMVSFEGRQAVLAGEKNPQEVHAGFFHILNVDYAVKASGFVGLNNGGPDLGLEAGIVRWF